jgi:hypothetical protein
MQRTTKYVALDVHQATTVAAVRAANGRVIARTVLPTEEPAIVEFFRGMRGAARRRGGRHAGAVAARRAGPAGGAGACMRPGGSGAEAGTSTLDSLPGHTRPFPHPRKLLEPIPSGPHPCKLRRLSSRARGCSPHMRRPARVTRGGQPNPLTERRLRPGGTRVQQPIVHGHQPVVHGHQPIVRGHQPVVHGHQPIVRGHPPVVRGHPPVVHGH